MLGFKNFLLDEDGAGVVEMILIIVVLIGLVLIFKKQLTTLVNNIFQTISRELVKCERQYNDICHNAFHAGVTVSVYCTGSRQESDTYQYSMHEFRGCSRVSFCAVLQTIVG